MPYSQGLISPRAFKELIRITRPGGVIAWNIATGYEAYGRDYERYEEIVMGLVREKAWEFLKPVKVNVLSTLRSPIRLLIVFQKHERMCFTDCGASFLRGWTTSGGIQCEGYTYIMRRK